MPDNNYTVHTDAEVHTISFYTRKPRLFPRISSGALRNNADSHLFRPSAILFRPTHGLLRLPNSPALQRARPRQRSRQPVRRNSIKVLLWGQLSGRGAREARTKRGDPALKTRNPNIEIRDKHEWSKSQCPQRTSWCTNAFRPFGGCAWA